MISIYSRCSFQCFCQCRQMRKCFYHQCRDFCILLRHWTSARVASSMFYHRTRSSRSSSSALTVSCLETIASRTNGSWNQSQSSVLILEKYKMCEMCTDMWQAAFLEKLLSVQKTCTVCNCLFFFFNECSFWSLNSRIFLKQIVWACWASWMSPKHASLASQDRLEKSSAMLALSCLRNSEIAAIPFLKSVSRPQNEIYSPAHISL